MGAWQLCTPWLLLALDEPGIKYGRPSSVVPGFLLSLFAESVYSFGFPNFDA